tara:strand:+ start:352 stop:561 length:210 start_codon:yes stop_codon:yes gene_type:complete
MAGKHWRDSMNERNQDWINSREKPKSGQWHGGKGYRSRVANSDAYRDNWDKIFGGDKTSGTSDNQESSE